MSTRGAFGVRIDGQDKVTYNHFDSYPSGLGDDFLRAASNLLKDRPSLEFMARGLRVVPKNIKPTQEEIERLAPYTNLQVSNRSTEDWYCLLRETQGDLEAVLKAGLYEDGIEFMGDSVFCEYAYILNLDENIIEAYLGFQKEPSGSRFKATRSDRGYFSVKLMGTISLETLTDLEGASRLLASILEEGEEE